MKTMRAVCIYAYGGPEVLVYEDAPCPRDPLWPARLQFLDGELKLHPLKWSSSGDVTCFAEANALIRVPANQSSMDKDAVVDFLLTSDRMEVE